MNAFLRWAPALLLIGTAGLLLNEFLFDWGQPATLIFAFSNILGLALIIFGVYLRQHGGGEGSQD